MKLLVISDTHLNLPVSLAKYTILSDLFHQADRIILNGDFWEGYLLSFDQFIKSDWQKLFPILRQKKAIYIYGNHDKAKASDDRVNRFSVKQTDRYEETIGQYHFIFEHGNRIIPLVDDHMHWKKPPYFMMLFANTLHKILVRCFGNLFLQLFFRKLNKKGIQRLKKELKPNEIYVCGHSHAKTIDLPNQFVNSGVAKHGVIQWIWIDEKADITPGETWYDE